MVAPNEQTGKLSVPPLVKKEALKGQGRLIPQALCSRTAEVPGLHIHSALASLSTALLISTLSARHMAAQISAKRQWSLPL